ncbi:MAG TPA: bacteriocin fulvocin C-related protein [Taishania sp.]|nr:bacteriocin fulvocin C-related protein [Taishania sp.]
MKFFVLLLVCLATTLLGCEKFLGKRFEADKKIYEVCNFKSSTSVVKMNYEKIKNASSVQEAKVIFNAFTPEESAEVWKYRLLQIKENGKWSKEQYQLFDICINEILNANFFQSYPVELKEFELEIQKLFDEQTAYEIFCTFNDLKLNKSISESTGLSVSCECSTESDWCGVGETGRNRSKCVAKSGCGGGRGCGTLWRYSCSGNCMIRMDS